MDKVLKWLTLLFLGGSIAALSFAKVDFTQVSSILLAAGAVLGSWAGLCMHPPWNPNAPPVAAEKGEGP